MEKEKHYANIVVSKKENAEVEIKGEIPRERVGMYRDAAIQELLKTAEIHGFRRGHVPEPIFIQKFGEYAILEKTAEKALQEAYPLILQEYDVRAVDTPRITITKLALGNPIGFTITVPAYPEFSLPDYKTIAKEVLAKRIEGEVSVSDRELEETIQNIRKSMAKGAADSPEIKLPPLTEELVQSWHFAGIDDFRAKLRGDIQREKEMREKEKIRIAIADAIIEKAAIPLPLIFVEAEIDKILAEFKGNIKQMGLEFSNYLKKIEKTEEGLRSEWRPDAEKRARLQLVLNEIAKAEDIRADKEKVEERVRHILKHHHKPVRSRNAGGDASPEAVRAYVATLLKNEKVFELLESQNESS